MYLHPITHKDKYDKITALQTNGWLFESHCWMDEGGSWPRTCKWCGAVADRDMHIKGRAMNYLCPKNPIIEELVTTLGKVAAIMQDLEITKFDRALLNRGVNLLRHHGADV